MPVQRVFGSTTPLIGTAQSPCIDMSHILRTTGMYLYLIPAVHAPEALASNLQFFQISLACRGLSHSLGPVLVANLVILRAHIAEAVQTTPVPHSLRLGVSLLVCCHSRRPFHSIPFHSDLRE
jgi:hypothetical protein